MLNIVKRKPVSVRLVEDMDFVKYQGTGNDFIMIDGRNNTFSISADEIQGLCDRRFGIGADGLIILLNHNDYDFEMDYYNADGSKSFCGNGSRCAQAFAKELGIINENSTFLAIDGKHLGELRGALYATKMGDVSLVKKLNQDYFIDTGSPHYIRFVDDVNAVDVEKEGRSIRNQAEYKEQGCNVNFVDFKNQQLHVRTYERGVEAETYSCGTGVTAVAIAAVVKGLVNANEVSLITKGGELRIALEQDSPNRFTNIWLIGPAEKVYAGTLAQ